MLNPIISSSLLINFLHYSLGLLLLLSFLRRNLSLLLRNHWPPYDSLLVDYFLLVFRPIISQHNPFLLKNPIDSILNTSILRFFTTISSYFQNSLIQIFSISSLIPLYLTNRLNHFVISLSKHLYLPINYLNHQFLSLNYLIYYLMLIFHLLTTLIHLISLFFLFNLLPNPLSIYCNPLIYYYNHLPFISISPTTAYSSLIRSLILFRLFYHHYRLLY